MMDRRAFLKSGGIALFSLGAGPSFLGRTALATTEPGPFRRRKILVTIFQRGAMDGLAAVPPLAEKALREVRPRLAMSAARKAGGEGLLDLGVDFGLHPAMGELLPLWKDGALGIVHAVGSPDPTRSHFDAQDYMETATPGRKGTPDGWLNRVAGRLGHDATPFRAVSLTSALPRSLYGEQPALAVTDLSRFRVDLPGAAGAARVAGKGFESLYEETSANLLRDTASETFEAMEVIERLRRDRSLRRGEGYPKSPLGRSLLQIALLIKANVGLEVAFAESGGWDTHVQQGTIRGTFARNASDLARSISAFWRDLGQHRDDVVVMTMTEFGRTVAENGSGGTDHGHGSCLFVLGAEVDGGKVHGSFPGISKDALYEGRDLAVTTDFRSIFSEVVGRHLGVEIRKSPGDAMGRGEIFPGWEGPALPLFRPS